MTSVCNGETFSEKDNPLHLMMALEVRDRLEASLMRLGSRTRTIIIWHFGLVGKEKTFREIAKELHISTGRVAQIYHKAMRELRVLRPLRIYGDIPDQTIEAMKGIDPPHLPQYTVESKAEDDKTEDDAVLPERVIDLRQYLYPRTIFKIIKVDRE
jgi:DNA-directed RNA polymerase, sigma subunit (sigma70/sigma32)